MRSDFLDIKGKKFNWLTALDVVEKQPHIKNRSIYWKCLCVCGKTVDVAGTVLRAEKQISCGCIRKTKKWGDRLSEQKTKPIETQAQLRLYKTYQKTASKRGITFNLLLEDFIYYLNKPCYYCNTLNSNTLNLDTSRENRKYSYNGVDRVDNNKGYDKENCVSCCRICNTAKMGQTKEEFLQWVEKVYKFNLP